MSSIWNPSCQDVTSEVLEVFMGQHPQEDPNIIKLKEAGMTLARMVFYPKEPWPLKEANTYLNKNLTLFKDQIKEF